MRTSEKVATISAALYAVHRDLENPRKDAKGQVRGRQDYRYLSLPALIDHAKSALKEAQVAVIQDVATDDNGIGVRTVFLHLTGEWVEVGPVSMPLTTTNPQELGSAITYLRRYALAAALNLAADEDDDAASATSSPARQVTSAASTEPSSGRDGVSERGEGAVPYGEGGTAPDPQPSTPSAQPDGHHEHVWAPSPTLKDWRFCIVKGCGKAERIPEGAKA